MRRAMSGMMAALALSAAGPLAAEAPAVGDMAGEWQVDLRLSLDDAPYSQPMTLAIGEDGAVTGIFYGSPILDGRAGSAQDRSCVAFRSEDGSGPYHSSACLVEGRMIGQTWSEGRSFVLPWTAERQ